MSDGAPAPIRAADVVGDLEHEPSLLDLVDHLLDKGCVLTGSLVLGLADVDLVRVQLSLLISAEDRLSAPGSAPAPGVGVGRDGAL